MKKIIAALLTLSCMIGLQTACSEQDLNAKAQTNAEINRVGSHHAAPSFSLNASGQYTGFSSLPELKNYTAQAAGEDGYFVTENLKSIANQQLWDDFVEAAGQGNNAGIRIASFFPESPERPYFNDLFFHDGSYYLFDSSSDNRRAEPFSYLLTLRGENGIPLKESGVIVLTNDNTLTFQKYMTAMYSSNYEISKSFSANQLVMFQS